MKDVLIVIPAIKKQVAFPDDLVKKLAGKTLIQRAIDKAKSVSDNICVITDSKEITLISERNEVNVLYDKDINTDVSHQLASLYPYIKKIIGENPHAVCISAYCPLIKKEEIQKSYTKFLEEDCNLLVTTELASHPPFVEDTSSFEDFLNSKSKKFLVQNGAIAIFDAKLIDNQNEELKLSSYELEKSFEIRNFRDWWICEKLLLKKKILFNVTGSVKVGTGHVYRALSLAHEISDHQVAFCCKEDELEFINGILNDRYVIYPIKENIYEDVLDKYRPNLIVNDVLNTEEKEMISFLNRGMLVVNFEDLGPGALCADLVFNELYEVPQYKSANTYWGRDYLFVRDEFDTATVNVFEDKVKRILLTFGGSDPSNYTLKTLKLIKNICIDLRLELNIVLGIGYQFYDELNEFLRENSNLQVKILNGSVTMSQEMENIQVALSSNGRTVYELAHMNIPSIILSHNKREETHSFANFDTGFLRLGILDNENQDELTNTFSNLISDQELRKKLYLKAQNINFVENKKKVKELILNLLETGCI